MQISPGTQLVWSLSGSEAVNLGMPKIEPDHLYCALLKFVELNDETIARLLTNSSEAPAVCEERDDLAPKFKDLPNSTTEIRHAVRKEAEHGTHKLEGNLIHRSDISRKIFEKAIEMANKEDSPTYPTHLLQVLMESPTPAMKKVLQLEEHIPDWLQELEPEEAQGKSMIQPYPSWIQLIQDLTPKKGFSVPSSSQPQIKVIASALSAPHPSPLLLICEPAIDTLALVGKTKMDHLSDINLLKANHNKILSATSDKEDQEVIGREIAKGVDEALQDEKSWLFFDLTKGTEDETSFLSHLLPLAKKEPRLILAVAEKMYHSMIRKDEAAEASFRSIWLHDLEASKKLSRI